LRLAAQPKGTVSLAAQGLSRRSITSPVQLTTYYLGYREVRDVYDEARKTLGPKAICSR